MAGQVAGRFTDGAWLAELAAVRDPAQVAAAVAAAPGIREQPGGVGGRCGGAAAGAVVLRLVDCSLLIPPRAGPDGRSRYAMLETLRTAADHPPLPTSAWPAAWRSSRYSDSVPDRGEMAERCAQIGRENCAARPSQSCAAPRADRRAGR